MSEGKQIALDLFEEHRAAYLALARAHGFALWAEHRTPITVDDVRAVCPPPEFIDGRMMGGIFRDPAWVATGDYVKSRRKECHGRPIALFEPKNKKGVDKCASSFHRSGNAPGRVSNLPSSLPGSPVAEVTA